MESFERSLVESAERAAISAIDSARPNEPQNRASAIADRDPASRYPEPNAGVRGRARLMPIRSATSHVTAHGAGRDTADTGQRPP